MPQLEGMHSPGSETGYLLPPAGIKSSVGDVYRFHRVIPYYPPDPCIRPNEADLVCPPENVGTSNASMPPAGISTMPISDRFAFYKAREGSGRTQCHPRDGQSVVEQPCPYSNSVGYPTGIPPGNFDLRYKGTPTQNIRPKQVADDAGCHDLMPGSGYSYSPCWPMPEGFRGVPSSMIANQGSSHPQSQARQFTSPNGLAAGGHRNPTPYSAAQQGSPSHPVTPQTPYINPETMMGQQQQQAPVYANPVNSHPYICQPVYDRRYLQDCPLQDGPPADSYTFL